MVVQLALFGKTSKQLNSDDGFTFRDENLECCAELELAERFAKKFKLKFNIY